MSLDNNSHLKTKIKYTVSSHDEQTQNHCIKDSVCAKLHKMKKNEKIFSESNQQESSLKNIVN